MTSERTCHFTGDDAWKCGTSCTCQHFNWNNKGQAAMTSELRPAVAVWIDAEEAYARSHKPDPKGGRYTFADPFAPAAVIEADREAVRAYWYRQGKDDGWQCREEQATELAKFKALAETLAGAVKAFMPTHINLRMPHPDDSFIVPLDVSMGELRALDAVLRKWEEARDAS